MKEAVLCSVCGTEPPAKAAFHIQDFSVVRCPRCGVLRVSPRLTPAALQAYYGSEYWKSQDSVTRGYFDYAGDEANIRRTFRRRLRWLNRKRTLPTGRSLDVGCAYGFLVQEALAAGWDAHGIEWSRHAVAGAPSAIRPRITVGTLRAANLAAGTWDLITLWDYLEHSPDPKADLQAVARLLKPGGRVSIIIPDAGSLLARILGPRWEEYQKPQEHLYFFTGRQLLRLLRELGFAEVQREWAGKYASLDFACSRFKPHTGLFFLAACSLRWLLRLFKLEHLVIYVNPRDKLHVVCEKVR